MYPPGIDAMMRIRSRRAHMPKGQQRSNRESKKPKQPKKPAGPPAPFGVPSGRPNPFVPVKKP
jgi:hypothetical protein